MYTGIKIFPLSAILTLLSFLFPNISPSQTLLWSKHIGGTNADASHGMAVDAAGNVYTTGAFYGTVDFNPGAGVFNLTSGGGNDAFVLKLDANGNFIWAKRLGGAGAQEAFSLALDAAGNIYTTGHFTGTADFDPAATTSNLTSAGGWDMYVSKLTSNGIFVWAKRFGGTGDEVGNSICIDRSGNVLTTGTFEGTGDFNPGTGVFNLTSAGNEDIFVSKIDNNGNFVFAKNMGGTNQDNGNSIAVDSIGNVYTTGFFYATADFDPGPSTFNITSVGQTDVFISKLDSSGNMVFAKALQGTYTDVGFSIVLDSRANIHVGGYTDGLMDFDPGPGIDSSTNYTGTNDAFIAKYTSSGNFLWATNFGNVNADAVGAMTLDSLGNIYSTGSFTYATDFDPGPGVSYLTSNGPANDVFIYKLDSSGNFRWVRGFGGTSNEWAYAICLDRYQNVHLCGEFSGVCEVDPDSATVLNFTSAGSDDIYITKLNPCQNVLPVTLNITSCDSFSYNNNTYSVSGNYMHRFVTAHGCDSTVTLMLTIHSSSAGIDSIAACDNYTWIDGNNYTTNNTSATYNYAGGAANGCDSTVTLHLTINNFTTGIDDQTACNSFTWIDGNTYTSSNSTATYSFPNPQGCDSIVTLHLVITTVDDSVAQSGNTLTANQAGGTYQWVDCNSGYQPILNETNQSFTPTVGGIYAVIVTVGGCSDTSACVDMLSLGMNEYFPGAMAHIYPNPASNVLNVAFTVSQSSAFTVKLKDIRGRNVKQLNYTVESGTTIVIIPLEELESGMYLLEITNGIQTEIMKLDVQ